MATDNPRLYTDLSAWWPLMSPPQHYVEEAADLIPLLLEGWTGPNKPTLLELGSGGGSLAYHLKDRFSLTLTDRSPGMLAVNARVNPECEFFQGDMTSLDLGREFDRVVVHDAIMYATTPEAVRATLRTAARHCRTGGVVVVLPDCVRETFTSQSDCGGEDAPDGRGLRYLEWSWDPDPTDHTCQVEYVFVFRDTDGRIRIEHDQHLEGCFRRADWLAWFEEVGLRPRIHRDQWNRDVFRGTKISQRADETEIAS
jgi:trans-aconitate methyltransferase